jgi:hypothetical protein
MATVLIRRDDGGVSVMSTRDGADIEREIAKWQTSHTERALSWRVVPNEMDLTDPYRDAWGDDGQAIVHNMPKAREIHRARIRERRAPLLAEQDLALMLVDEDETLTAAVRLQRRRAIIARKKALRDAPADPRIEAAQTIETLRAVDPLTEAS